MVIRKEATGVALASAKMLATALKEGGDLSVALAEHEARLRPIIKRLQARSHRMAAIFIPQCNVVFRLRNFILRNMPRSRLGGYFSNAIRSEIEPARNR